MLNLVDVQQVSVFDVAEVGCFAVICMLLIHCTFDSMAPQGILEQRPRLAG